MSDKADDKPKIYSPFIMIDCIEPITTKVFDVPLSEYIDSPTGEYREEVFTFDIKEISIKYYCTCETVIVKNGKEKTFPTILIAFTDGTEILVKSTLEKFVKEFIAEYLLKLNDIFPAENA